MKQGLIGEEAIAAQVARDSAIRAAGRDMRKSMPPAIPTPTAVFSVPEVTKC